ncbi:PEP-CTERM sorting domain-containing protein [Thauera sp. WB-2]|nr:PEP-CTERM sorting domain-containing protein [Thauera sp. WB-2]WBL65082.1 PEP-CTERM sorting domain-containing protein [Thauera sp. WB-2]
MSIDNVRFTPAPASAVPEPTVLALLSLGLLGLGAVRRKQRTA